MAQIVPVNDRDDILPEYRDTPVGRLLEYHNLGRVDGAVAAPQLLIGMCMDSRKSLRIPNDFAFVLRTAGANMRDNEFRISYAIAVGGIRTIVLIAHTDCGPRAGTTIARFATLRSRRPSSGYATRWSSCCRRPPACARSIPGSPSSHCSTASRMICSASCAPTSRPPAVRESPRYVRCLPRRWSESLPLRTPRTLIRMAPHVTNKIARPVLSVALALIGAAACSPTGPATLTPLSVVLSGPSVVQGHDTTVGGVVSYVCSFRLAATGKGGFDGDVASWASGHYTYQGKTGAPYSAAYSSVDSLFAPYSQVPAGSQVSKILYNIWTGPFQFSMVLYYTTLDSPTVDSTTFSNTCQ
jgi:hypothetical protein